MGSGLRVGALEALGDPYHLCHLCISAAGLTFALTVSRCQDVTLGTEAPDLHHLYLLHPAFPSILLDLANATGTVTASEGRSGAGGGLCAQMRGEDAPIVPPRGGVCWQVTCVPAMPGHFPWGRCHPGPSPESNGGIPGSWGEDPCCLEVLKAEGQCCPLPKGPRS